ncbi:hypothetical protein PI124_g18988 [Phytophthora idaei]|nr:hypothetical protein PI125_g19873 [Phytophthora idaei]KAG3135142.1 hypothetical protein PI126_g18378 [Phytophthora idaei]KAG3235996.1 hypothetical protein PI124_g18988 [Phytophthora idaei]
MTIKAAMPYTLQGKSDTLRLFLAKKDDRKRRNIGVSDATGLEELIVPQGGYDTLGVSNEDLGEVDEVEEAN